MRLNHFPWIAQLVVLHFITFSFSAYSDATPPSHAPLPHFQASVAVTSDAVVRLEKATQSFLQSESGKQFLTSPTLSNIVKRCLGTESREVCDDAVPVLLQELGVHLVEFLSSEKGFSKEMNEMLEAEPKLKEELSTIRQAIKQKIDVEKIKTLYKKFAKLYLSAKTLPDSPLKLNAVVALPLKELEAMLVKVGARVIATNPELLGGVESIAKDAGAMKVVLLRPSPQTGQPRLLGYLNSIAEGKPSSEMTEIEKRVQDNVRKQVHPLLKSLKENAIEGRWGTLDFQFQ